MCPQREALRQRRLAAELLSATCLSMITSPIGEAFDRALELDPVVPEDQLALLEQLDRREAAARAI